MTFPESQKGHAASRLTLCGMNRQYLLKAADTLDLFDSLAGLFITLGDTWKVAFVLLIQQLRFLAWSLPDFDTVEATDHEKQRP